MPMIMTMNGEQQSLAAAPLDLRTTRRERGGSVPTSPDSLVTGGSPAPPACTETDSLGTQVPAVKEESSGARKRPSNSALPLRKRKIRVDPDLQTENGDGSQHTAQKNEWASGASPLPTVRIWTPYEHYLVASSDSPRICLGPYCPPSVLIPEPIGLAPHQADALLSMVALATHQDEDGDTPLHIAVVQGKMAMVCELLQILLMARRSLDIYNHLRQTPLHLAVITQQANMVETLLRAGADPTALDRNGQTPLHLCCEYDQADCLSLLLLQRLSSTCLEIRNFEGLSPLHLAVLHGLKDLATMLVNAGADINAMDIKSGQSPLMHAVESNNGDMVHFLIELGCDVNSQSYSGNTALHCACGRGQVDTVRLLLKNGADSGIKNYHNDTPVMVTTNKKIADVLRGRSSKQIRVQDQIYVTTSPTHRSRVIESGSPSPNQSRGCSPSSTMALPQQRNSQSPPTPAIALCSRQLLPTSPHSPGCIYPIVRMDYNT